MSEMKCITCNRWTPCVHCLAAADSQAEPEPAAAPAAAPARRRIGWKLAGALIIGAISIAATLSSLANTGIIYRQMRALEQISERCGR